MRIAFEYVLQSGWQEIHGWKYDQIKVRVGFIDCAAKAFKLPSRAYISCRVELLIGPDASWKTAVAGIAKV